MLEVLERFPQLGTIHDYRALPPGERALYSQYTLLKIEELRKSPAIKLDIGRKGG